MAVNDAGDELIFTFRGDGFLYKMIRIMVGTLLKIGNGRLAPDSIPAIIAQKTEMRQDPQLIQKDCIWFTLPMNKKNTSFAALVQQEKAKACVLFFSGKTGWFLANLQSFPQRF